MLCIFEGRKIEPPAGYQGVVSQINSLPSKTCLYFHGISYSQLPDYSRLYLLMLTCMITFL